MNDMLPPPVAAAAVPTAGPLDGGGAGWGTAVVAVIAVDVVAATVGSLGFVGWFVLLWNGSVGESMALPLLAACTAPAFLLWLGSGWLAARVMRDRRGWWLLTLGPLAAVAAVSVLGLW